MKLLFASLILFSAFLSRADVVLDPAPASGRAVVIRLMGGITGFDENAYKVVRSSMAALLAQGVLDQFVTTSWGREGGHEFCVELNPDPSLNIDMIVNMLKTVHPGNNTIYEQRIQDTCLHPELQ